MNGSQTGGLSRPSLIPADTGTANNNNKVFALRHTHQTLQPEELWVEIRQLLKH